MDEKDRTAMTDSLEVIASTSAENLQQGEESEPQIHNALASLNDKMSRLTDILERI